MTRSPGMRSRRRSASVGVASAIDSYPRSITSLFTPVRSEDLATCISCGLCLNDCPTYRVLGEEADSPRGRIQLIRVLVTSLTPPEPSLVGHLDACLVCRACETACPSGVAFFAGCVMREAFGETDRATVRVLEREGLRVSTPSEQVCCGALHAHAGEAEEARTLARLNIDAFTGGETKIVVNAAGCGSHLKAYGDVLRDDLAWAERARMFAMRVRDASEVAKPKPARIGRGLRVVYQDACHLAHGQRIRTQPRALLRAIEGVELLEIADAERCCGSAGIYNLTHPDVAAELQRQKVAAIIDVHPDVVVSANPGCMLQITAGLRRARSSVPVVHLMRFLDDPAAFA